MLTPDANWPEWVVYVPLLAFIAISVEGKEDMTRDDIFIVSSMFLCLAFGFLMQMLPSFWMYHSALALSSIFCIVGLIVIFQTRAELFTILNEKSENVIHHAMFKV